MKFRLNSNARELIPSSLSSAHAPVALTAALRGVELAVALTSRSLGGSVAIDPEHGSTRSKARCVRSLMLA